MTKHLYIHIPYCQHICSYCDFCRKAIKKEDNEINLYVDKVIEEVKNNSIKGQYQTIYIGGGTPNYLKDELLDKLLSCLNEYLDFSDKYEFCLEANPEFISQTQVNIFKKNKINRISLGVQSTNNEILTFLERNATIQMVQDAIDLLHSINLYNINLDFIYALPKLTIKDLDDSFDFIIKNQIPHISYYALEVKSGSKLKLAKYEVNQDIEEQHLEYINQKMEQLNYHRYEVSNFCINKDYECIHNKAYWLTKDWKAIGYGASGFENQTLYDIKGSYLKWDFKYDKLNDADYYFQILMMGLRLTEGIDVVNDLKNKKAYEFYLDKITNCSLINNHLRANNLNLLNEILVKLIKDN